MSGPSPAARARRVALIACRVLDAEIAALTAKAAHIVHRETLELGLHDQPDVLRARLAAAIAQAEANPDVEVVVLAYGLCGLALVGLAPRRCPLVVPRAHDCVTLLLGSKERYAACMQTNPGTYWYSPGWNRDRRVPGPDREAQLRAAYARQFDAEEVDALLEMERETFSHYSRAVHTDHALPGDEAARRYAESCAAALGWRFDYRPGDPALLRDLLNGPWPAERFLVVNPGEAIKSAGDGSIVKAVPAPS